MTASSKRRLYVAWLAMIAGFALAHALNLCADFPNHTVWASDYAKYTDEGWYANAAVRAHLFGNWYLAQDFNPAAAVPVWPFLEWLLFFFTGVTVQAARGLAVAFFFLNLLLSYRLLRAGSPRWVGLLALTFLVTSPFLYCFSRLAILEPLLTALVLSALNLAVRLHRMRRPLWVAAAIGLLCTLMMLTKATALFLLPALGWAFLLPFWLARKQRPGGLRVALRCAGMAACGFGLTFGFWMAMIVRQGLLPDYRYYFFINNYPKPPESYWPLVAFWWSFHGGLWIDHLLIPLAGLLAVGTVFAWRSHYGRRLLLDPVFGSSVLAVAGYLLFMSALNHPQPRYFAVVAVFCFLMAAQGAGAVLADRARLARLLGCGVVAVSVIAVAVNGAETLNFAAHPEYSFVTATRQLTRYIDAHPNGKRMLVFISGDEIMLITRLPALCDDFGTVTLPVKLAHYQPGWYATWNDFDPGTLEELHRRYLLEQVAAFRAFDNPGRNSLVLFKLHPLPANRIRNLGPYALRQALAGDTVDIPIE